MTLIALKRISRSLPKGATFEQDGTRAQTLIALGLAKAHTPEPARRTYTRRRDADAPEPVA